MAGLVQEGLVVVEAALGAGDQMDDGGRVGRDHARARALLRPVVEVEPDALVRGQVEADAGERVQADGHAPILRVEVGEGRHPPQVGDVVGGRLGIVLGTEDAVEPLLPHGAPDAVLLARGLLERCGERLEVDVLPRRAPRDRVGLAGELGVERLGLLHQPVARAVEARGRIGGEIAELVAAGVVVEDRELRLGRAERQRLAAELDALGEDRVLELVGLVGELADDDSAGCGLAQAVEALALFAACAVLGRAQRLVLLAGEQIVVARDDRGLLAGLLLADADGAAFLGPLVQIPRELRLEAVRCPDQPHSSAPQAGLDAESLERSFVTAPPRPHLYPEIEEDGTPQKRFDLRSGARADGADHTPALPDDDPLLGLRLDPDLRAHPAGLGVELVDLHRDRVRHLFAGQLEAPFRARSRRSGPRGGGRCAAPPRSSAALPGGGRQGRPAAARGRRG